MVGRYGKPLIGPATDHAELAPSVEHRASAPIWIMNPDEQAHHCTCDGRNTYLVLNKPPDTGNVRHMS